MWVLYWLAAFVVYVVVLVTLVKVIGWLIHRKDKKKVEFEDY
jgi:hypothetical protein